MENNARNDLVSVGVTSVKLSNPAPVGTKRKSIVITNTSAGAHVITIVKGLNPAVAGYGIPLQVNERMVDATSEGYTCTQLQINAISDLAGGQVSIEEVLE